MKIIIYRTLLGILFLFFCNIINNEFNSWLISTESGKTYIIAIYMLAYAILLIATIKAFTLINRFAKK